MSVTIRDMSKPPGGSWEDMRMLSFYSGGAARQARLLKPTCTPCPKKVRQVAPKGGVDS